MIQREKLVKAVGARSIIEKPTVLDEYTGDISFVNPVKPTCVVKPKNKAALQKLVKLAKDTQTPLVPVSSGPPHFRGDTVPGIGGAIIVDMSGMNKIIRVDRYHRVAMVEPGVTFEELIPAVKKEGIRLNMPIIPKKNKSVVASMLEREPVAMPKYQWDNSDPLACVEVIFGTGDDFRTGQAAGPGTIEEQWAAGAVQKAPYGPGPIAWHRLIQGAQGTMGIVTWASMRCELLPAVEEPFMIGSDDLNTLLVLTAWLMRRRLLNECFILNRTDLAAIMARKWPKDYRTFQNTLPTWILFYNLAGYEYFPKDRVNYQIKDITVMNQRLGTEAVKEIGGISANELLSAIQRPCPEPYWKLRYKGACEDIFFLTTYDKLEGFINQMNGLVDQAGYPSSDLGIYIQPVVQGTSCHCEFNLFYNPENAAETERIKTLAAGATKSLMSRGAFFSRPYGESAEMILNRDTSTVVALKKIKKVLDPNNVMNPGKICF
jgi:FAD/FMN-containing dehydrogenase